MISCRLCGSQIGKELIDCTIVLSFIISTINFYHNDICTTNNSYDISHFHLITSRGRIWEFMKPGGWIFHLQGKTLWPPIRKSRIILLGFCSNIKFLSITQKWEKAFH